MKIQLDINEKANKTLKILKIKQDFPSINIAGKVVLEQACDMIEETGEMISITKERLYDEN